MQTADGAATTASYWTPYTTVTDAAGNARVTATDALGRLTAVWEDPNGFNYRTSYGYDALDDLVAVSRVGQSRTFWYDSLGRMTQASNPESGVTNYSYDANGNLVSKTDARNITTSYQYDSLNRITQKSYNDGTPTVNYGYDAGANCVGRLVYTGAYYSNDWYACDPLGRVSASWQRTAGQVLALAPPADTTRQWDR